MEFGFLILLLSSALFGHGSGYTSSPCGGYLTEHRGEFFSPNYPNNYPNGAHCTWTLSAGERQVISLNFTFVSLESCCDHIRVYDGSGAQLKRLGSVPGDQRTVFTSSSRYMTVNFTTDSSVNKQGFRAEWAFKDTEMTPSPQTEDTELTQKPQTKGIWETITDTEFTPSPQTEDILPTNPPQTEPGQVDCLSGQMNIAISRSYIDSLGYSWYDLYLGVRNCKASISNNYITFNFPLYSCNTWKKIQNEHIIYKNIIKTTKTAAEAISTHFVLEVSCIIRRDAVVETFYEAKEIMNATIGRELQFNPTVTFYHTSSFSYPITDLPYQVNFGQELFVQVQLRPENPSFHLFVDSCVASPNHNFMTQTITLIQHGCPRDATLHIYTNGKSYYSRFRFRALSFPHTRNKVFLKCNVLICADSDSSSRCRQGCRPNRK